ncbi:MAG: membrane-bound lytic murein transglycosylase MltF [Pseudomonadota bacterium]
MHKTPLSSAELLRVESARATQILKWLASSGVLGAIVTLLIACSDATGTGDIIERGELRLITRNGPTTYFLDRDGPRGIDYELASALAQELGVELAVEQAFSLDAMFEALDRNEADIAGAGLTMTEARSLLYSSSRPYGQQTPQVVYKVGKRRPRTLDGLRGIRIGLIAGSSHEAQLQAARDGGLDWLRWETIPGSDTLALLQAVVQEELDAAIVDSREFAIQQNLVPKLAVAFNLGQPQNVVWYLQKDVQGTDFLAAVDAFLTDRENDGTLKALRNLYFNRDERISRVDSQTFVGAVRQTLPVYQSLIQIVASENELDWELLAAISYQESHWNPEATSPTGVRGMMMLTLTTAEELGVEERTDPGQSLRGGARYFLDLRRRLPDDIYEPDRTWMALAAYNVGMRHLEDARVLTQRRGGDPHLWSDVMRALPSLQDQLVYPTLRYGYARGLEAVSYVQNIRHYNTILRWQTARARRPQPPADASELLPEALKNLSLLAL